MKCHTAWSGVGALTVVLATAALLGHGNNLSWAQRGFGPAAARQANGAHSIIPVFGGSAMAATVPDGSRVWGYSLALGGWKEYALPEGVTAIPVVDGGSAIGLGLRGTQITEVAAYSNETGTWHVQRLLAPRSGSLDPRVDDDLVTYSVGGYSYAFSARRGAWDVIEGEGVAMERNHAIIVDAQANRISVFSAETGRWDTLAPDAK